MRSFLIQDAGRPSLFVAALCVMLAIGCGGSSKPAERSDLFERTSVDLGAIRLESEYSASYRLGNSTAFPIVISSIKSSCGCIVADFDRSPLAAGGVRDIALKLSTRGQTTLGKLVKHAWVQFESGGTVELELTAEVQADFKLEPRRLVFSPDKAALTLTLERRLLDEPTFSALMLVASEDHYGIAEVESSPERRTFAVALKKAAAGSVLPDIYFSTAVDRKAIPFGTVSCFREGPTLRPSTLVILTEDAASSSPKRFDLISFESEPVRIVDVACDDEDSQRLLKIDFNPGRDATSFTISLAEKPDRPVVSTLVAVRYQSVDGGSGGRLELRCHLVTTPASSASPVP